MKLADEVKVALITAACVLTIAIVFKNIFHAQPDFVLSNAPVYLLILYLITRGKSRRSECNKPLYWSISIIFVTLFIIGFYAI
jgi:hypothetical protein